MKRLLSLLLVLCFAFPLFAGSAFAARDYSAYTVEVEISQGDTVSSLCRARSMNYDEVRSAILIVNGLSSDEKLNAVRPGQKLLLPKSAEDAKAIITLHDSTIVPVVPAEKVLQYTVKKGDTIFSICKAHKLNYSESRKAIKELNNWTSDTQLAKIYEGQVIYLPVSDVVSEEITTVYSKASDAGINISTAAGDKLEYYLVSYKMSSGETVKSVCGYLGWKYTDESAEMIRAINGLSKLTDVQAGRSYLFPSGSPDGAVYGVYSHAVISGDTAGNLCSSYGVNYAEVSTILQGLNPKQNLSAIQRGTKILLVAPGTGEEVKIQIRNGSGKAENLPVITAHPAPAAVIEGGSCSFSARYQNATWAVWHFVSPDGKTDLTYEAASKKFPALKIYSGMYSDMKLENVPKDLNGWKVYCRYTNNAGSTDTSSALLTVTPKSDTLIGTWAEKIAGRGVITIQKTGNGTYDIAVRWSSSAFESANWSMKGTDDGKGSIRYTGCLSYTRTYTTDTAYSDKINYQDGSGRFSLNTDGTMTWSSDKGDVPAGTLFIRAK